MQQRRLPTVQHQSTNQPYGQLDGATLLGDAHFIMAPEIINGLNKGLRDRFGKMAESYIRKVKHELIKKQRAPKEVHHSYISGLADAFGMDMSDEYRRLFHGKINSLYDEIE